MAFLSACPLPASFTWPHRDGGERVVMPSHSTLKGGYGKWLRETPYFPGLFEDVHLVLALYPSDVEITPEGVAKKLVELRRARGSQASLFS